MMSGRSWSEGYRFGFNGMEAEFENSTWDNHSLFRWYSSNLARWMSVDPEASIYPDISPYVSYLNSPIWFIDENGDSIKIFNSNNLKKPVLVVATDLYVADIILPNAFSFNGPELILDFEGTNKSDAFMVNFDAGFSLMGGAQVGVSLVFIEEGQDAGGVFLYRQGGPNIGAAIGAELVAGDIDFNEENSAGSQLNRFTFEGKSQGGGGGISTFSIRNTYAYTDGEWHYKPFMKRPDKVYEGVLTGVGIGGGGTYEFNDAALFSVVVDPPKNNGPKEKIAKE
jgi:RHS repeat-associated protein